MPLMQGKGHVSENIREFSKGPTHAHTAEKFGEKRAHAQDVAVALHQDDKTKGGMDHKAEVAKMHPEHLHKLVQHAAAGKAGPEAQQMAQQAMQGQQQDPNAMEDQSAPENKFGSMFSGGGGDEPAEAAPASRMSMFGGR